MINTYIRWAYPTGPSLSTCAIDGNFCEPTTPVTPVNPDPVPEDENPPVTNTPVIPTPAPPLTIDDLNNDFSAPPPRPRPTPVKESDLIAQTTTINNNQPYPLIGLLPSMPESGSGVGSEKEKSKSYLWILVAAAAAGTIYYVSKKGK